VIILDYIKHYRCTLCETAYPPPVDFYTCPTCGEQGILDIEYDYDALRSIVDRAYFARETERSMWRYYPLMSVKDKNTRSLAVGWTPLYPTNRLHASIGIESLYIKDEGANPTGSLKDRASAVAVLKAIETGNTTVAASSTGNAASSLAGNAARLGLKSVIFVPKRAPKGKLAQLLAYGARVISVEGDYKAAFTLSKAAIDHYGWYNRNAAINPHMVEGKKTVAYEIAEQLGFTLPDWVVVSVGDGCTIAGLYKGFYDLKALGITGRIPKILGVQSEGCAPFIEAARKNCGLEESNEDTIADSIAVGIPRNPVKALNAVRYSRGAWVTVSDEAILKAITTLGSQEGVFAEPAAAASLAGAEAALKQGIIDKADTAVLINTGNGLKDTQSVQDYLKGPVRLKPDLDALIDYIDHEEA